MEPALVDVRVVLQLEIINGEMETIYKFERHCNKFDNAYNLLKIKEC